MMLNRNGFTLLEIVVVLGLLSLIFGIATIKFDSMFLKSRIQASAKGISDHFAYAVSRAYTTGKYHTLVLDLATGKYLIKLGREDDDEAVEILKRRLAKGVKFTDIQIGYDTYESPGSVSIEISPLGITNDVLINLEDGKKAYSVLFNSLVQGVKYFDEHKEYEELQDVPSI